ncbi:MAG TPA: hypothetical protein VFQ16_06705 [Burkholderiaceae bacterium]|nr:hypothetical protein [Burkholderiaceae bacterium]
MNRSTSPPERGAPAPADLPPQAPWQLALIGFTPFERKALESCFRLGAASLPLSLQAYRLADCDLLIVDSTLPAVVDTLRERQALGRTITVGDVPVPDALAHMPRPINPQRLLRRIGELLAGRAPAAPQESTPAAPDDDAKRLTQVLVVAPDAGVLRLLAFHLVRFGFDVHLARGLADGLAAEARYGCDFVFVARQLSDSDGFALMRHLRDMAFVSDHPAPKVVLLSESDDAAERARAAAAGCNAVLHPAIPFADLVAVVGDRRVFNAATADTALSPLTR